MTEPKHIPLTARLREYADTMAEEFRRVLQVPDDALVHLDCECPPCPGKGLDGNGMNHCAECCWGSRVVADIDCPKHGKAAY